MFSKVVWNSAGLTNGSVIVFDSGAQFRRATLVGHQGGVFGVAISPDGLAIASAGRDGTVKLRAAPVPPMALVHTLVGHMAYVSFTAFSPDGKRLATGSADRTVRIWDATSGALQTTFTGHKGGVTCGTFAAGGRELVTEGTSDLGRVARPAQRPGLCAGRQDTRVGRG
jgi:WD40 repeat protein